MREKRVNGLILAAGLSSRMGDFKPLMPLHEKTLIENAIDSLLLSGVGQVVVVLGHRGKELETILRSRYIGDSILTVYNHDYATTDMFTSIRVGLSVMPPCDAFFLLPGDMPVVAKETFLAVYRAMPQDGTAITFPTLEGYRKHPPLISADLIPEIMAYRGEGGLRGFWQLHPDLIKTVAVDDIGCWTDLDTFEQYFSCINRYKNQRRT